MTDPIEKKERSRRQLVRSLVNGERRMHELPEEISADEGAAVRREALEEMSGVSLRNTGIYSFDAQRASRQHCENLIGVTQVPTGIIGPLSIRGEYVSPDEELYVPLATTEGALIASTNRGCSALRRAGGAVVRVDDVGMTRAPVFRTSGVEETRRFVGWVREHEEEIRQVAEATSSHLKLEDIRTQAFGTSVFLRFRFTSGDAMGMNMSTIACDRAVREVIEPGTDVPCVALSGNYCVDKKPAAVNFLEGRGKRIHAEVALDGSVLKRDLKTNARALVEVQYRKNLMGSIAAGSMGFNAHYANLLAAFFVATGQDIAQVAEGAVGVTTVEQRGPEGVYASVYLPDAPVGAVGGGTGLGTQAEALRLLGIDPDHQGVGNAAMRLAEIVGATVLAGELSLLAALSSRDLARAHERLGRERKSD